MEVLLDVLGIMSHIVSEFCVFAYVHNIYITVYFQHVLHVEEVVLYQYPMYSTIIGTMRHLLTVTVHGPGVFLDHQLTSPEFDLKVKPFNLLDNCIVHLHFHVSIEYYVNPCNIVLYQCQHVHLCLL